MGLSLRERKAAEWAVRRRRGAHLAVGLSLIGACLTPHGPMSSLDRGPAQARAAGSGSTARPSSAFGPTWPPTEANLLAVLGQDAWTHPLAGPVRRMPLTDSRVFGAARPGDRPIECRNGHCGVDLGGEIWGEYVRAAHDGVVDRVERDRDERGGQYVRISHHDGTVFTQYFHLAAIPRTIEPGVRVKAGDLIGLLGNTGVKESAPHLHFTISVRPSEEVPERYMDPEPLVALWPLRIPLEGSALGLVATIAKPGLPLGSAPLDPTRKRRMSKHKQGAGESVKTVPKPSKADETAAEPDSSTAE